MPMYVHLGGELCLSDKMIVGIFDFDEMTAAKRPDFIDFLSHAEKDNLLENIGGHLPLSVIVSLDKIYLSPLSVSSLLERLAQGHLYGDDDHLTNVRKPVSSKFS